MDKISILVTNKCPIECPNCCYAKNFGENLSTEENIEFGKVLKQIGCSEITISGGDPLLHDDILRISKEFKDMGFVIHLDTTGLPFFNGRFNQEDVIQLSENIDLIGVPIDGSDDEIINIFRPQHDFEIAKMTLDFLEENQFNVSVNTVVHNRNMTDLNNIYRIITEHENIKRWELHQFVGNSCSDIDINDEEFSLAVMGIDNYNNIQISPKMNSSKKDFNYLDFNGDVIRAIDGNICRLFNIKGMNEEDIKYQLGLYFK